MSSENENKKEREKDWFQILAANIGSLTALTAGFLFGWTSPSIPILISPDGGYNFTLEQCSYFPVITSITVMIFCVIPSLIIDKIGRKYSFLLIAVPYTMACVLYASSRNIYLFYLARVLTGMSDASLFAVLPVYLGEILTPRVRGVWGCVLSIQVYVGQFLINAIGGYLDIQTSALITLAVPVVFLCVFPSLLPESPYYLLMKGKPELAKQSLRTLRRVQDVDAEFLQLETAVKRQLADSSTWRELFTVASNRKAIIAVVFMRIAQQTSGFAAFSTYTKYIFQKSAGNFTATECAMIFTASLVVTSVLGSYLMDKLGRRFTMMWSLAGMVLVLGGISAYFFLEEYDVGVDLSEVKFVPLVGLLLYVLLWGTGLGVVPNLMLSELFSASMKGKGLCLANIAFGFGVSVNTKVFQLLEVNFGMFSPFALFSFLSLVSLVITYFIVPETRRKTLEEIQLSLKGEKNAVIKKSVVI